MTRNRRTFASVALAVVLTIPLLAQTAQETVNLDGIAKIRDEGLKRSQVMQIASYLTDVHGPRLTGSPGIKAAAQWVVTRLNDWKLSNVHLESWGPFGRGWSNENLHVVMVNPYRFTLIASTKAWTPGTAGAIKGDVVQGVVTTQADFERFRGQLRGKFVLAVAPRAVTAQFQPNATRFTDQQLAALANPPAPRGQGGGQQGGGGQPGARGGAPGGGGPRGQNGTPRPLTVAQRNQFYLDEGVLAVIEHGSGTGGNIAIQSGGQWAVNAPAVPVQIVLAVEHYGLLFRNVENKIPVSLEVNVENKFYDQDLNSFNIVGEIPGTDNTDEVVMLGAHFDSWHAGTGATDNAAGSAVMLEAMRILKATGLPMRRTVRIGLWTGEEQGLLGSEAYVTQHFALRRTMELKPEHAKFSVYFNVDNGTGQIRGVYMQGNEGARPVLDAWIQPFKDLGMTTLTARGAGGTDHGSFDDVGLPGFQFIQDEIEYDSRTHHTSMDTWERLESKDMIQNATIVAGFAYLAANRDQLFPRKPLPPPPRGQGGGGQGGGGQGGNRGQ